MTAKFWDAIAERVIGFGCIAGTVTEAINPAYLSIDLNQAYGLGIFGILLATGQSKAAIRAIRRALREDDDV